MRLYHEINDCSLAVDIVRRELQIPLELIWVDVPKKLLPNGANYFEVNSKGQVPTLELDDGRRMTEGAVIMQYLADQRPEFGLLPPAGSFERYRVLEWLNYFGMELHKSCFTPLFRKTTPPEYRQIVLETLNGRLKWMDGQLADRDYLTGSTFTIADAHGYTIAMWTRLHNVDTSALAHLERFLQRVGSRESVKAAKEAESAVKALL